MPAIRKGIKQMRSEQLPDLYRDLLQLTEEEPQAARNLSRQIRMALQMYARLLAELEDSSSGDSTISLSHVYVAQKRLEDAFEGTPNGAMSSAVEASLPEYSRKRTLLRKIAILEALATSGTEPMSGSEIARLMKAKGLAGNVPTVITHLSRMKRDGLIAALASGVFRITDAGRQELRKESERQLANGYDR
ncbi:MAG: hypothetical protein ABL996_23120 [Micropepsaceae bacterium]